MKFYLPLSSRQIDFYGQIFDAILKYYPVGIKGDDPAYREFPGQIALGDIIVDNIHNSKHFKTRWKDFDKKISIESKKEVEGLTGAIRPSFSSNMIIKEFRHEDLIHFKKLHYSVSLVGPFFTIYGFDETVISDEGRSYGSVNMVTVSPYKEFEAHFNFIRSKIEARFKGYKFVPFKLHSMLIDGVYDPYNDNNEYTINRALFNEDVEGYNTLKMRGNSSYGMDQWVINDGKGPFTKLSPPTPA